MIENKRLGKFEYKLVKINDIKNHEYLIIELSINEELRALLKENFIVTDGESTENDYILSNIQYKRYLSKGYLMRELYSGYKWMLSDKRLIDTGKAEFKFSSVGEFELMQTELRQMIKRLIEIIRDYDKINIRVTFEA